MFISGVIYDSSHKRSLKVLILKVIVLSPIVNIHDSEDRVTTLKSLRFRKGETLVQTPTAERRVSRTQGTGVGRSSCSGAAY